MTQSSTHAERATRAKRPRQPHVVIEDHDVRIRELIRIGALFVINHSGGKDSQAMTAIVRALVPADQLLVVHADLGEEVEWEGVQEHIRSTIGGLPLIVCSNPNKTLLSMAEEKGMWPSAKNRQCTSDLKRGPIEREIRRYLKANPRFGGLVVNCMGMRAQESSSRAKKPVLKWNGDNSKAGRNWYDWLPIQSLLLDDVWTAIRAAGQEPHFAYGLGMSRLSCKFCILANVKDLQISAVHNPCAYRQHVLLERKIGHTMSMDGRGLEERTGIYVEEELGEAA